jgi:hypothetical protein
MFKNVLFVWLVVLSPVVSAADTVYWYRVTTKEIHHGDGYRYYYGSSPSTIKELAKEISDKVPVLLNNLIAWDDKGNAIPWSDYDKNATGDILLMPDDIASILTLKGDPKQQKKLEKPEKSDKSGTPSF